ncbi:hypothetical protein IMSAGC019_00544 [Lachnospiraceae bacterium]|nr:hypothetical protein IMSAGC019_00544 [Lachnospiraceae bacterium]
MKKIMKFVLGFVAAIFIIIAAFWGSFVYVSEYKITKADTSVSPDGTYELVLQAVGEADFPFGPASGRLVLYKGKRRISQAGFELFDDGRSIRSNIWEVTWHEDYVAVILSGDEQSDEQIILYFDGKKESKQLTEGDEMAEAEDVNESGEINSQTADLGRSEGQEGIKLEESDSDANSEIVIDSIEKMNKCMIPEQSFDVALDDWGDVTFVSCTPISWRVNEEPSFFLVRDGQILYKFPCNNLKEYGGMFESIGAVAFRDINNDGKKDIIIIFNYVSGAGPTGMVPRPALRIFLAGENEFYLAEDIMEDIGQHILQKDMTIETICNYLKDKN